MLTLALTAGLAGFIGSLIQETVHETVCTKVKVVKNMVVKPKKTKNEDIIIDAEKVSK
jgi:hypothetical protein